MRLVRAVLHAHSRWSYDGHWELRQIARFYSAFGIDAVLMSEHDTGFDPDCFPAYRHACAAASTRRCRLIPGIEYSCPENDTHILTWGMDRFLAEHRPVDETLKAVAAAGGVAVLAHPIRRDAWRQFDSEWVPYLSGIELWNRKSDGITWSRHAWALIQQTGLAATTGHDFHRLRHVYPLSMAFDFPMDRDNLESQCVEALRAGKGCPQLFRRPLIHGPGTPVTTVHDQLEKLRRKLRGRPTLGAPPA